MIRFKQTSTAAIAVVAAGLAWCLTAACTGDQRPYDQVFNVRADYQALSAAGADTKLAQMVADIRRAKDTVDIAVSTLENETVAQALVDADQRGVEVRVVSDWDSRDAAGLVLLEDHDIVPVYGDAALQYLPDPTLSQVVAECSNHQDLGYKKCSCSVDGQGACSSAQGSMKRPGSYNLMSHNFAIIDQFTVWNFPVLDGADQPWVGWRVESSMLAYDMGDEFDQMHGGVFATTLDTYQGPLKSTTNNSARYLTNQGLMRVWFNPQERLMKTVIDHAYQARSSLWIMTDNLANPDLVDALEYKQRNGFEVRIMVHPDYQVGGQIQTRLEDLGVRYAPEDLGHLPTLAILDTQVDRNGVRPGREVMGLSHGLIRAAPFEIETHEPADEVFIYPADLFVDGTLWMVDEDGAEVGKSEMIDRFESRWTALWKRAR